MINFDMTPGEAVIMLDAMRANIRNMQRYGFDVATLKAYNARIESLESMLAGSRPAITIHISGGTVQHVEKRNFRGEIIINDYDDREATPSGEPYEPAIW